MLSKGEITTAEYLTELSARQQEEEKEEESDQSQTNTTAALGAVSE
jgi:hypothetical protein